mgnify:CR=1 FL=1|jgi:hypothetical protein
MKLLNEDVYKIKVQEEDGEIFFEFPDQLITEMAWQAGDVLVWSKTGEGWLLTKENKK